MRIDDRLQALVAEQAAEWYVAHRDCALDQAGQQAFMRWLQSSPMHVAEYLAIAGMAQDICDAARRDATPLQSLLREAGVPDRVVLLEGSVPTSGCRTRAPVDHRSRVVGPRRAALSTRHPFARRVAGLALSALAVVALVGGLWRYASRPQVQDYATRHGEQRSLQLPDNTIVRLNADSAIAVRFDRRDRRVEIVRGQAYFEVAKDPARAFGVQVGDLLIKDIGTEFDVYRQGTDTTVTVVEGRVQVWRAPPSPRRWFDPGRRLPMPAGHMPILDLAAGRQARIAASGAVESQGAADMQRTTAWTEGNIAFENQPIAAVAAEFNRYNNQQVSVEDPRIGALPISGTFDAHDVPAFVAFLESLPGVRVEASRSYVRVVAAARPRHK